MAGGGIVAPWERVSSRPSSKSVLCGCPLRTATVDRRVTDTQVGGPEGD